MSATGASITVDGDCWEHVHPDEHSVFDFSFWTHHHPGNKVATQNNRPNPIAHFAEVGLAHISFPHHHMMSQFSGKRRYLGYLGRLHDVVDFAALPASVQTLEMSAIVGAVPMGDSAGGAEACGSPGEVGNDPSVGHQYMMYMTEFRNGREELHWKYASPKSGKFVAHNSLVLGADDQLRQRVAWALAQMVVIGPGLGTTDAVELYATFYDIFVRHAFGSFGAMLKEVTYSPAMARYLTYLDSGRSGTSQRGRVANSLLRRLDNLNALVDHW